MSSVGDKQPPVEIHCLRFELEKEESCPASSCNWKVKDESRTEIGYHKEHLRTGRTWSWSAVVQLKLTIDFFKKHFIQNNFKQEWWDAPLHPSPRVPCIVHVLYYYGTFNNQLKN